MLEESTESDWEKQRKAMKVMAGKLPDSSKVGKRIKTEETKKNDTETNAKVMLARKLFEESIDMFREGEMSWEEAVNDLSKVLKGI